MLWVSIKQMMIVVIFR